VATVGRISRAERESDRHRRAQVISAGCPDTLFMWGMGARWRLGWTISGAVRKSSNRCVLVEAFQVYP
jgi:hypothetical protein